MTSDLHATAAARLRDVGQRYTAHRRRLVDILERARTPLAIADILRRRRDLAQSSVYRNLSALEQAGVVRRVRTEEGFGRYELTEDLTGHHHHLVCSICGRVEDVTIPASIEQTLDRELDDLAHGAGFERVSHRLDLIGTCGSCR